MSGHIPADDTACDALKMSRIRDYLELDNAGPEVVEWARRLVWLERVGLVAVGVVGERAWSLVRAWERRNG